MIERLKSISLPGLLTALAVAAITGLGLYLRAGPPHDAVFSSLGVKYSSIDAYYHMRLVDFLGANFPQLPAIDPYLAYPVNHGLVGQHFFSWFVGLCAWIAGGGAPSPETVDMVGVYFPAVAGALVTIPVYFIGREIFNRWVGLLAALLAVIIPSEFLGRSTLGFTDYHVLETLFTTVTIMFLLFALKHGRRSGYRFKNWRDWRAIKSTLLYSLLAGLFLGLYFLTWAGSLVFFFIFLAAFLTMFLIDSWQRRDTTYLTIVATGLFLIPLLCTLAVSSRFYVVALLITFLVPLAVGVLAQFLAGKPKIMFPVALLLLGGISLGIFYAANSSLFKLIFEQFTIFSQSSATKTTTIEAQPFFKAFEGTPEGTQRLYNTPAWLNLATGVWLNLFGGIILIGFLIYGAAKKQLDSDRGASFTLFLIWTLVILLMTAAQRRFAYYYTINSALLTAYMSAVVFIFIRQAASLLSTLDVYPWLAHLKRLSSMAVPDQDFVALAPQSKGRRKREAVPSGTPVVIRWAGISLALVIVFLMAILPLIRGKDINASAASGEREIRHPIGDMITAPPYVPPNSWLQAIDWLRENTPEPLGDPEAYYQQFAPAADGASFDYPETAYGVLSWWDYGYWITRVGHRIPFVNPSQDPVAITTTAQLLLNQDPAAAENKLRDIGTPYVMIDQDMAAAKIWAIIEWAGDDLENYIEAYYIAQSANQVRTQWYFKPAYFETLMVRLYNFGGQVVPATRTLVIKWQYVTADIGQVKLVKETKDFGSYEEAQTYIDANPGENLEIVSDSHLLSPVALPALTDFELVYQSPATSNQVSIFKLNN